MKKLLPRVILLGALAIPAALATLAAEPARAQAPATATVVLHVDGMHRATCPVTVRTVVSTASAMRR
jgi:hypothetical protein